MDSKKTAILTGRFSATGQIDATETSGGQSQPISAGDRRQGGDRRDYQNYCLGVPYPHDRRRANGRRQRDNLVAVMAYYGV